MNPYSSFQKGDRVAATNTVFKMPGTVERIQAITGLVRVRWDSRPGMFGMVVPAFSEWVHPSHLALVSREVSQATFSKGDVVEIVAGHPNQDYRAALGVVTGVIEDRPPHVPRYVVKPYGPSKPFEQLSPGPFTYRANELKARRANGLVPVNFVRQALGLKPVEPPKPKWTPLGYVEDQAGFLFATSVPATPPTSQHLRGLSIDIAPSPEAREWLAALSEPKAITISDGMRRRGITTEDAIKGLVVRAELAERDSARERLRANGLKLDLDAAREQRDDEYQLRDEAQAELDSVGRERDELKSKLANAERAAVFNSEAVVAEAEKLRAEIRELKNKLGEAVNRSRRRGEAIERIQNAVRGL